MANPTRSNIKTNSLIGGLALASLGADIASIVLFPHISLLAFILGMFGSLVSSFIFAKAFGKHLSYKQQCISGAALGLLCLAVTPLILSPALAPALVILKVATVFGVCGFLLTAGISALVSKLRSHRNADVSFSLDDYDHTTPVTMPIFAPAHSATKTHRATKTHKPTNAAPITQEATYVDAQAFATGASAIPSPSSL